MATTTPPSPLKEEDRLMDLEEVAEQLGRISTRSVRRLIARGDLPQPVKVLIPLSSLQVIDLMPCD